MTNQDSWQVAEKAWRNSKQRGVAKRKCPNCFNRWKREGCKEGEKPPLFPSDYNGACPVCKTELSEPTFGF